MLVLNAADDQLPSGSLSVALSLPSSSSNTAASHGAKPALIFLTVSGADFLLHHSLNTQLQNEFQIASLRLFGRYLGPSELRRNLSDSPETSHPSGAVKWGRTERLLVMLRVNWSIKIPAALLQLKLLQPASLSFCPENLLQNYHCISSPW